jgi:hypothetical protein
MQKGVPFLLLHSIHSSLDVILITTDLLFVVFLSFLQVPQRFSHALHLLLALHTLPMLAPDITSDCIKYSLEPVVTRDLSLFF